MIVTVTLTPALDKTVILPGFRVDRVNRIQSVRLDPGGKGINVSKALRSLGTDSLATGILGGSAGDWIESRLRELGIPSDFVRVEQETRTNLKVVDPEARTNTDINEPGPPAEAGVIEAVYRKAEEAAAPGGIVVLAGKAPAGASPAVFADWIARLKRREVKTCLDADGELLIEGVKAGPFLIKPNDAELSRLTGRTFSGIADMARAAKELAAGSVGMAVVSLGGDGALFVTGTQALRGYGLRVPVQSTVGAGDSMMAAMVHGMSRGMSFRDTCALAVAVSAAAVTTPGTQPAEMSLVRELLRQVRLEEI